MKPTGELDFVRLDFDRRLILHATLDFFDLMRESVMAAGVVSLSGTPTQNQTLAANVTDVDGIPAGAPIAYQWQQSADNGVTWTDIAGAAKGSLSLQQAYVGRLVRAVVSYTDAAGNAEQDFSPATASVGNVNDVGIATITGTPVQGQTLTAGVTDLDGLANVAITYRWQQLINGTWSNIANCHGGDLYASSRAGRPAGAGSRDLHGSAGRD